MADATPEIPIADTTPVKHPSFYLQAIPEDVAYRILKNIDEAVRGHDDEDHTLRGRMIRSAGIPDGLES